MSKLSVVIAAYNVERYIGKAIESVVNQTFEDIEVIIIDDASTDGTHEIIDSYAEKDNRIKVIHNNINTGTSLVRVFGVQESTGEYIMFLDGDDSLTHDACEKAYNSIKQEEVDILQFGFDVLCESSDLFKEEIEEYKNAVKFTDQKIISNAENGLLSQMNIPYSASASVWNKIYTAEPLKKVCEDIPNEYITYGEDWLFTYISLYYAHSYTYIPDKIYQYRYGIGISTENSLPRNRLKSISGFMCVYKYIESWLENKNHSKLCKPSFDILRERLINGLAYIYLVKCSKDDIQFFTDCILEHCDIQDIVTMISYGVLHFNMIEQHKAAEICCSLNQFKTTRTEVKTVGIYCSEIKNNDKGKEISKIAKIWKSLGYKVVLLIDSDTNSDIKMFEDNTCFNDVDFLFPFWNNIIPFIQSRIFDWNRNIRQYNIDAIVYFEPKNKDLLSDMLAIKSTGCSLIMHTDSRFYTDVADKNIDYALMMINLGKIYRLANLVVSSSNVDDSWWKANGLNSTQLHMTPGHDEKIYPLEHDFISSDWRYIFNHCITDTQPLGGNQRQEIELALNAFTDHISLGIRERAANLYKETDYYVSQYEYYKKEYDYYLNEYQFYKSKYEEAKENATYDLEQINAVINENKELKRSAEEIRSSFSFRIGLAITYVPRKIKSLLKRK